MNELPNATKVWNNSPAELKIELCSEQALQLDDDLYNELIESLKTALASYGELRATRLAPMPGKYSAGFLLNPEALQASESGLPGLSLTFGDNPVAPDNMDMLQSLSQTWQWDEADNVVPEAPFRVTLRSVNSLHLPVDERINLVQKSLYAVTRRLLPKALIFPQSQCCIDPASYLENNPDSEDYFPIYGLINTRVFTTDEENEKSVFMDTLGLHTLGLPDAQCLASDAQTDFAELAYWLYNLAEYMRETPGYFEDGDSIIGLNEDEWELNYSTALIEPERCVLNINTMQINLDDIDVAPSTETDGEN